MIPADNRPLQPERHRRLRGLLRERGAVRVSELSALLDISENTIRRDLAHLEEEGFCSRTKGGAVLREEAGYASPVLPAPTPEHAAMAAAAASRVQSGETVILDAGPVCRAMAEELKTKSHITVITSSLYVAEALAGRPTLEVILSGGILRDRTGSLTGSPAEEFFSGIHADRLFLSMDGVSAETGLSDRSMEDSAVKQRMISCADQVLVLVERDNLGKTALRKIAPLDKADFIITGKNADPEVIQALSDAGAALITADSEGYDLYPGSGEI